MLTLHNPFDTYESWALDVEYCIIHAEDGYDTLEFEVPALYEHADCLIYETQIDEQDNQYLIKAISTNSSRITVSCALNLDDWKKRIIFEYRPTNVTMQQALNEILPSGWNVVGNLPTNHATVEQSEGQPIVDATPYRILPYISDTFKRKYAFNIYTKTLMVIDPYSVPTLGGYLTDELNLRALNRTGKTTSYATKLHCYSKKDDNGNPVTFSAINGGKDYVEDYTYCDKIIEEVWRDERYTIAESLLSAAQTRIKELAHPSETYECDVIDLQKAQIEQYACMEFAVHRKLWLIDRKLKAKTEHRIVEYKEFRGRDNSYMHNSITLSNVAAKITNKVQGAIITAQQAEQIAKTTTEGLNGMYTSAEIDSMFAQQGQAIMDLSGDLTGQIQNAIQAEQQRADAAYAPMPITGSAVFAAAGSKQIAVPYTNYNVTLTPSAAGNCWATVASKKLTIHVSAPMTVWYSVTERKT